MRKPCFEFLQLMDLSAQRAGGKGINRTVDAARLIEEELVICEFVKSSTVRVALGVGPDINESVDQEIQFGGGAVVDQPTEKITAEDVEVLNVSGDHFATVTIVIIGVVTLRQDGRHSQSEDADEAREEQSPG